MGPIFVILLAVIAGTVVNRMLGSGAMAHTGLRYGAAIAGAFVCAWLVGSALQDASFMSSPPGPYTLLAALIGGFAGAFGAGYWLQRHAE